MRRIGKQVKSLCGARHCIQRCMTIMSLDEKIWEDGQCGKAESQETCQLWYGKETK